jgi:hypothetical protein
MISAEVIPEPFRFNPLKHHLSYLRDFVNIREDRQGRNDITGLIKELKSVGTSVMDVYTGSLTISTICREIAGYLEIRKLDKPGEFAEWTGKRNNNFRTMVLSDTSQWILKYHNDLSRFVHIFPARMSPLSFRVKANTLKSAILYIIYIGKDYISSKDLNRARKLSDLSPVKDTAEAEAITEMIEILRMQDGDSS